MKRGKDVKNSCVNKESDLIDCINRSNTCKWFDCPLFTI